MKIDTKPYEEKMSSACKHLEKELQAIRAGRANPAVLDKVAVEYYGTPTPVAQLAAVAVPEARVLTISPWDTKLVKEISKAIMSSDIGINADDLCALVGLIGRELRVGRHCEGLLGFRCSGFFGSGRGLFGRYGCVPGGCGSVVRLGLAAAGEAHRAHQHCEHQAEDFLHVFHCLSPKIVSERCSLI